MALSHRSVTQPQTHDHFIQLPYRSDRFDKYGNAVPIRACCVVNGYVLIGSPLDKSLSETGCGDSEDYYKINSFIHNLSPVVRIS